MTSPVASAFAGSPPRAISALPTSGRDLAALDLEDVRIVPKASSAEELLKAERGELEIVAKVRTREGVKEVMGVVWWEKTKGVFTVKIEGGLLNFVKREDFVKGMERDGEITDGVVKGWLTTDASVVGSIVTVNTTSLFQAALYKASGLDGVEAESKGTVTGVGLKVQYHGESSEWYQLYSKIAKESKKAAEEDAERLEGAKSAVKALVDRLLAEGRLSVSKAAGLSAKEAAERAKKAASEILSREAAEKIDPVKHQAYGRVYYPLVDLLLRDASETEFAQFFTTVIFGDGTITPYYVELALGEFKPRSEALPYDRLHKLALWLAVLEKYRPVFEKYGVDITPSVYVRKDAIELRFDLKAAGLLFALGGGPVWRVYDEYLREVGRNLWDRGFIKAEEMLETVREAFKDVKVKWHIDESGERPVLRMRFVKEVKGREVEIANLNVYVQETLMGKALHAEFKGARERAEALASLLRAWGAEAEAKRAGEEWWYVALSTRQLYTVDHSEFKAALEAFVKRAEEKGLMTKEQAERWLAMINTGLNTIEIAGVEFSVKPKWEGTKPETVEIIYWTTDKAQLEKAANALKAFGLVDGIDFTAEWDDKARGEIWLKAGALEKAVEALKGAGLREGEDFAVYRARRGGGRIRIKNPGQNLEKALEAFKKAGLVEGEDYTPPSGQGYIRLAIPEALWTIAWRAKKGDGRAKETLGQLLDVAKRLGIRHYFEERVRPVLMAGTNNAVGKKVTLEKEGVAVEITGFKVEWVSFKDKPCNWPAELCRPKVTISYKVGGEERSFTVTWGVVSKKGKIYADVKKTTLDKAAALIAVAVWEGDEEERNKIIEKAKRGDTVRLTLDNLLAMAQYDPSLLEWAMRVKRTAKHLRR